ncbi:restriction endonuclease subunit S [Segatella albensis]|uniref:restriction endonuclease subunit S n=1 Tax=Segatella albensis TaxID=77768 RepID=UPI0004208DF5|nr:restriction endonuclease subunit S [Segatella albensis]
MREGWEQYRFDEVFNLQMGKTPDRKTPQYFGGDNVWVSIRDLVKKEIFDSNEHITDEAILASNIRQVKKGTVIMSFKLTVGKCAIAGKDLYTNEAIIAFNLKEGYEIIPNFLYYYLQGYKWEGANKAVMGLTLNKATISKHKIAFPPLSTQQSIVSELDKINELISLKKSQLEDLDSLAQSIFYDMFGDPVENEKGWATEVIGKIAPCVSYKGEIVSKEGKYWLLNLDMVESMTGRVIDRKYVEKSKIGNSTFTFNEDNVLYSKLRPYLNKVVIPNGNGYCTSELLPLLPDKKHLNRIFLAFVLRNKSFVDFINIKVAGAKMPRVSMTDFRNFKLILPPLPLQQTFAERISAIEQQKLQISSTIKTLETLLASRMQYWFD